MRIRRRLTCNSQVTFVSVAAWMSKRAVLHRKNALFYRTLNGALVGDIYMTLIHTCQLCGANSFDYLIELQRHATELAAQPGEWMPWNYRDRVATLRS